GHADRRRGARHVTVVVNGDRERICASRRKAAYFEEIRAARRRRPLHAWSKAAGAQQRGRAIGADHAERGIWTRSEENGNVVGTPGARVEFEPVDIAGHFNFTGCVARYGNRRRIGGVVAVIIGDELSYRERVATHR